MFKRLLASLLTIPVLLSLFLSGLSGGLALAAGTNLIANPSAETAVAGDPSTPDKWEKDNWGTNSVTFSRTATAHDGSYGLNVTVSSYTDGDAKWAFSPITVAAGTKYDFSDYYQATVPTSLVAQYDNGTTYKYVDLATLPASGTWQQTKVTFTSNATLPHLTIFHLINSVGSLTTDDFSLTQNTSSTPTVSLTNPGASVSGTVQLNATASDTNGIAGVQFKLDGTNLGAEVTAAPYTMGWNTTSVPNGTHSLTAVARNTLGVTATSTAVSVMVNNPVADGTNLISNPGLETGTGSPLMPTDWKSSSWGTNTTTFTYATSGHTGVHSGKVVTTAYTSGDAKWAFTPVAVTAGKQYTFSDWYKGTIATDVVAQFDDGAGNVSFQDLGAAAASATNWVQFANSFTVPAGMKNVIVLHTMAGVGTLFTDDYSLVTASAPTVAVTAPTGTVSGTVDLTASASDNTGIKNVQFKLDGSNIGSAVTTSPYTLSWNSAGAVNGTHTLTAVATNIGGLSTTSAPVTITVSNTASNPSNMIPNPGVETVSLGDKNAPDQWTPSSWGTNSTALTYVKTSGHTGTHSLKVQVSNYTDGDAKWYFNPVAVTPGTLYRYSDWYKSGVQTQVDVAFTMADGSTVYYFIGTASASSLNWAQFTSTFSVPKNAVTMTVYHLLQGNGTLTTDDYSLMPYSPIGFTRAIVSLTFDDGIQSIYTNGLPLLQKYGLTSTQYIISGYLNTDGYMTDAQVKAMDAAGNEIGSHTVDHSDLTTLTKLQVDRELANSQAALVKLLGKPVTDFASPYGMINSTVSTEIQKYYASHRGVEYGYNSKDNFNVYDLKVQDVDLRTTPADVQSWLDQAAATHTWLILVFHAVDPDTASAGQYDVTPATLDAILANVKASGLPVETMAQALSEVKPQL